MATSRIVFNDSPNAPRNSRVERGFSVSSHQSSSASASTGGPPDFAVVGEAQIVSPPTHFKISGDTRRRTTAFIRRPHFDHNSDFGGGGSGSGGFLASKPIWKPSS